MNEQIKIRANVDPDIWRRLQIQALGRKVSLHSLLGEILKRWLEKAEKRS